MIMKHEYAVYDKDNNLVFIGTSIQCAKYLGLTMGSFYCRVSRIKTGRFNGRYKGTIVAIGD